MASSEETLGRQHKRNDYFSVRPLSQVQEILLNAVLFSAQGTTQSLLAQGILPDQVIGRSFGAKSEDVAWFPAAYGLTAGTFMIIAGRIGDIWGHKRLFLVGWIWCGLWSLLAGLSIYSRSIIFFVVCRACQGIGTAITVPVSLAIIGSVYKEGHRKNVAFSIYAAGAPVGFTLGAALSALLAQLAHWPWAYYLAALVCSVLAVVAFFVVPDLRSEIQGSLPSEQLQVQEFDWLGAFTGVSGLVLFNVAWNRAPAVGWQSVQAIAPLTIGFVLSVTFFFVEKRAHQPLVPVEKISKDATWVLLITGMGWSSFGILIYYVVNFLTQLDGDTMLNVSAQLAPIPITGVLASVLASFLLKKGLRTAWLLAIALVWFCVGNTLLATTPIHQTY